MEWVDSAVPGSTTGKALDSEVSPGFWCLQEGIILLVVVWFVYLFLTVAAKNRKRHFLFLLQYVMWVGTGSEFLPVSDIKSWRRRRKGHFPCAVASLILKASWSFLHGSSPPPSSSFHFQPCSSSLFAKVFCIAGH